MKNSPYNRATNWLAARQRFWDGQDKAIKDDATMLKGNHLFAFGGSYQRNNDYLSKSDNGSTVNNQVSYLSTSAGFNWTSPVNYIPTSIPSSSYAGYESYYAYLTGMISSTQVMYTRALPSLSVLPIGTSATDKSIIPSYTTYFNDIWHIKPSFTLTYGFGWSLEMPPYEMQGKQVELVDANGQPVIKYGSVVISIDPWIYELRRLGAKEVDQFDLRLRFFGSNEQKIFEFLSEARAALLFLRNGWKVTLRDRPDLMLEFEGETIYAEVKHQNEKETDRRDAAALVAAGPESSPRNGTLATMPRRANEGPCNFTTIDGVFSLFGLAKYESIGVSRSVVLKATTRIPDLTNGLRKYCVRNSEAPERFCCLAKINARRSHR